MNNKETVIENFDCPVLSGIANVKITYLSFPGMKEAIEFDCNKTYDCGVVIATSDTAWRFDWSLCPKHSAVNNKGIR